MLGDCEVPADSTRGTCAVGVTFTESVVTINPEHGAATVHFLKVQMPGGPHLPAYPGIKS